MTLQEVERLFKMTTLSGATPHREPDFDAIKKQFAPDTEVRGTFWFLEENNTGYEGCLERWQFTAERDGKKISFWADLLPGYISAVQKPEPIIGPEIKE